jgi:hypothetical protein
MARPEYGGALGSRFRDGLRFVAVVDPPARNPHLLPLPPRLDCASCAPAAIAARAGIALALFVRRGIGGGKSERATSRMGPSADLGVGTRKIGPREGTASEARRARAQGRGACFGRFAWIRFIGGGGSGRIGFPARRRRWHERPLPCARQMGAQTARGAHR